MDPETRWNVLMRESHEATETWHWDNWWWYLQKPSWSDHAPVEWPSAVNFEAWMEVFGL